MATKKNDEVKPGYKSTEFWITAVVAIASLAWGAGIVDPAGDTGADKTFGFICSALSALGYSVSRGLAKKKAE
jgi:hypothetical protein|tara:strand:- start:696 stop:914 length:219 start_codon:yes stop_codon:yes gene_type:complete